MIGLPKITSLYGRIFAIFWLTILLVMLAIMLLAHLDPRKSKPISEGQLREIEGVRDHIERRFEDQQDFTHILQWFEEPFKRRKDDPRRKEQPKFFLTNLDGDILLAKRNKDFAYKVMRNFVTTIDQDREPKQRLYGSFLVAGPVPIRLAEQELLFYAGRKHSGTFYLIGQLFDRPIQMILLVMLISTPLLLWLAWALSQPARRLEKAAQRVSRGEFKMDPSLEQGSSEFRQAGASFNQMVEAVNQMISRQQRLLSDISHELRSPLTRLRMAQSLAARKQGESLELTRIDTEAQRLEQMIGKLLELSRMQVDSHQQFETQPLVSLWEPLLDDSQFEAEQMGKALTYSSVPNRRIACHPQLLMSALENIVRNAICYSKDCIKVSFNESKHRVEVIVEDNGEGVPQEELSAIFRPFYRVSTARDRHSGGTGLGLSITEGAIKQHNGTIEAQKSQLGGLLVKITLPVLVD
ncbi:envelope stress sensor histidine kinase CpxA [Marinomonas epiphytica]